MSDKTKENKREDQVIRGLSPDGINGLDAESTYYVRKLYKNYLFPEEFGPTPIDMWYDRLHYGRVDEKYNPIFLSEENLKPIPSTSRGAVFVVDFVADAFKDMLGYIKESLISGGACPDSVFSEIDAKIGWINLKSFYSTLLEVDYDRFASVYSPGRPASKKIKSFDSFIGEYINFTKTDLKPIITNSKFIFSSAVPPQISGLIIEIAEDRHDVDYLKMEYINDPLFTFYREAARMHGFMIDKNAPWRLVADVKSPEMKEYMDVYGVTPDNLFSYYYHKAHNLDLDYLKTHLIQVYNSYVDAYPIFKEDKITNGHNVSTQVERLPVTPDDIEKKYHLNFWLEKYIIMRNIEEKNKYSKARLTMIIKKAKNLNKHFDIYRALEYTNNNFKFSSHYRKTKKTNY